MRQARLKSHQRLLHISVRIYQINFRMGGVFDTHWTPIHENNYPATSFDEVELYVHPIALLTKNHCVLLAAAHLQSLWW